jgi:hypothetical protein
MSMATLEAPMLTKNWKLGLIGFAALAAIAVLTFGTLADQRPAPRIGAQMPEIVVVTVPETNAIHASQLAGAEAFVYP